MNTTCPSCKSDNVSNIKNNFTVPTLRCGSCKLDFVAEIQFNLEQLGISKIKSTSTDMEKIEGYINNFELDINVAKISLTKRIPILEKIAGKKILSVCEIGCSAGTAFKFFHENKINWIGLETNTKWIEHGRRMGIPILGLDLTDTNQKFDLIYFHQVLEHILDPREFMQTVHSHLNDGGIVFIAVPNHAGFTAIFPRIFYRFYKDNFGMLQYPYHLRAYSAKSIRHLFENTGFTNISARSVNNFDTCWGEWYSDKGSIKNRFLFKLFSLFGLGSLLIGIGKKKNIK
jgi:SAM-dependent methyltransferase